MSPLSCADFQEMASAFIDDRLEATEAMKLQGHLRECASCRQFMSNVYRVRDLMRAAEMKHALRASSPDFAAAVSRRIRKERVFVPAAPSRPAAPLRSPLWARLSGALAAAALLVVSGWSWYRVSLPEENVQVADSRLPDQDREEASMDSYLRQHTLGAMDTTFLGVPEGVEFASFEVGGNGVR